MIFLNTNSHHIYLEFRERDPEFDLTCIHSFEKFEASGADADVAEETAGVVNLAKLTKDELAELDVKLNERSLALGTELSLGDLNVVGRVLTGDDAATSELDGKNTTELKKLAKAAGISGFSKLKKAELIAVLQKHYDEQAADGGAVTTADVPTKGK
jgi:Rho termination factor, N-terminal domain